MHRFVSIQLSKDAAIPLYQQLHEQLKDMIMKNQLAEDEKLPPIRRLAQTLGINNITVVNAYRRLEQEDLLYSKVGSGTYVKPNQKAQKKISSGNQFHEQAYNIPTLNIMDQGRLQIPAGTINFASIIPSPDLFPVEDFKSLLNEVLDRDGGQTFAYQESQGHFPLRESLSLYLKYKGITADEDNIQVISGAQQGIDIIAKSLLNPGDFVITENPTYTGAIAAFKSRGARIIPVSVEPDGIRLDNLQTVFKKYQPKLMYITPNFQTPTGFSYSEDKKTALLKLCQKHNAYIIEDDSFTELSYDGNERHPLKTMDADQNVLYIKSFSKILMPGLRLAFLLAPSEIIPGLLSAKHSSDISTQGLMQRAFDLYLRKGLWEKHITYVKEIYQQRYHLMLEAMQQHLPAEITYIKPGGGLSFWLKLPTGYSGNYFYTQCLEKKIIISPGSLFCPDDHRDLEYFRLSYAALNPEEIQTGIIELSKCFTGGSPLSIRNSYSPLL